ncbi:MAG: transporter substrate-binding domain-containing protein [Burkholderiales bacterium]|nr:transporter substrate-binding domain-containing protein [Burkholderiales bacterium]
MCDFARYQDRLRSGNNSKRIWLTGILLALAFGGSASHAANEPTLVLSDTYDTPYTTETGDGFLDRVVDEAFRRAGLRLKMVRVSPERALLNANSGIEDGVSARIAGLEKNYPNLVRVPEKVLDFPFVAFASQAKLTSANWDTLASVSVGHIHGWKIFEQNLKPGTPTTIVDTAEQLFTMLDKNRIDVALYERWLGLALAKQMGIKNIRVVEPALADREMFIYLNKRHADKVPAIIAALRSLKADGTYTKICREKFAPLAASTTQCEVK